MDVAEWVCTCWMAWRCQQCCSWWLSNRAAQEDQLEVLQQAHSECFESATVHFIVLIISQRSEMQPLSRCWFNEWTQLSHTSKYCKYSENGSSKKEGRCCAWLWYSSGKGTGPWWVNRKWHFGVKWAWFVISVGRLGEVRPCFVPCQWSGSKGPTQFEQGCLVNVCKMLYSVELWEHRHE